MKKSPWIGLVEFSVNGTDHPLLSDARGAFVNVLIYTYSVDDFIDQARLWAKANHLLLEEWEDVEPFECRLKKSGVDIDSDLCKSARDLSETNPIAFGIFQNYTSDE